MNTDLILLISGAMIYRGYCGTIQYDERQMILHGCVYGSPGLNYQSNDVEGLKLEFRRVVNDHIKTKELMEANQANSYEQRRKEFADMIAEDEGIRLNPEWKEKWAKDGVRIEMAPPEELEKAEVKGYIDIPGMQDVTNEYEKLKQGVLMKIDEPILNLSNMQIVDGFGHVINPETYKIDESGNGIKIEFLQPQLNIPKYK